MLTNPAPRTDVLASPVLVDAPPVPPVPVTSGSGPPLATSRVTTWREYALSTAVSVLVLAALAGVAALVPDSLLDRLLHVTAATLGLFAMTFAFLGACAALSRFCRSVPEDGEEVAETSDAPPRSPTSTLDPGRRRFHRRAA